MFKLLHTPHTSWYTLLTPAGTPFSHQLVHPPHTSWYTLLITPAGTPSSHQLVHPPYHTSWYTLLTPAGTPCSHTSWYTLLTHQLVHPSHTSACSFSDVAQSSLLLHQPSMKPIYHPKQCSNMTNVCIDYYGKVHIIY